VSGPDLHADPFTALRVSYGMLLGEPDFEVLMGNPRGKGMLHAAWLHGRGLIWGFAVSWQPPTGGTQTGGALRVEKGLALDAWGRELRMDHAECLDLRAWATEQVRLMSNDTADPDDEHAGDTSTPPDDEPGQYTLDGWVVAEFATCLDHPVPALADPCDVTRQHEVCARVIETVALRVRDTPPLQAADHARVRTLLALDCDAGNAVPTCGDPACTDPDHTPVDPEVVAALEAVADVTPDERPCVLLDELRRLAALDSADLAPAVEDGDVAGLCPVTEDNAGVVLARLRVRVSGDDDCVRVDSVEVGLEDRRTLLPTATIQDLVAGFATGGPGGVTTDAGGPRLVRHSLRWWRDRTRFTFRVTRPVIRSSLVGSVVVTSLSPDDGWEPVGVADIQLRDGGHQVLIHLEQPPDYELVRVVIRGTGPKVVLGRSPLVPFAGVEGGPPGSAFDGDDAAVVSRLRRHRGDGGYDELNDEAGGETAGEAADGTGEVESQPGSAAGDRGTKSRSGGAPATDDGGRDQP
jgi:hypothetical protein